MAQWYPKMAEYDFEGWHADPYISREFHGVWGDFDVKLTIDKNYTVGSSEVGVGRSKGGAPFTVDHGAAGGEMEPWAASKERPVSGRGRAPLAPEVWRRAVGST